MKKELNELIKNHLPEATADALKDRLKELESAEAELKNLKTDIKGYEDGIQCLKDENTRLQDLELCEDKLEARKQVIHKNELELLTREELVKIKESIEELIKTKESMENKRIEDHIRMFDRIYKNSVLGKTAPVEDNYWKERCLLAEDFIVESPCNPDIDSAQIAAYDKWQEKVNERE